MDTFLVRKLNLSKFEKGRKEGKGKGKERKEGRKRVVLYLDSQVKSWVLKLLRSLRFLWPLLVLGKLQLSETIP